MKKILIIPLASILILTSMASCDGCGKKRTTHDSDGLEMTSTSTSDSESDAASADEAVPTAGGSSNANRNGGGSSAASNASSPSSSGQSQKTGENGKTNTQSRPAKDGTNAENSDGDYYTRNDTARKPTGSIK